MNNKFYLNYDSDCEIWLVYPDKLVWWDDGRGDGAADWIYGRRMEIEELDKLFNLTQEQYDKIYTHEKLEVDYKIADEFVKNSLHKNEYYKPNSAELKSMFGSCPCPKCGCLIQTEVDNDEGYCEECDEVVMIGGIL
jgi:hypothetical protein